MPGALITEETRAEVHRLSADEGMAQKAIAKALGIGAGSVSRILKEERPEPKPNGANGASALADGLPSHDKGNGAEALVDDTSSPNKGNGIDLDPKAMLEGIEVEPADDDQEDGDQNDDLAGQNPDSLPEADIDENGFCYAEGDVWLHHEEVGRRLTPGVWHITFRNNKPRPKLICGALKAIARTRSDIKESYGLLLKFTNVDGIECQIPIASERWSAGGEGVRAELLGLGLFINPSEPRKFGEYVMHQDPMTRALAVDRTGWHDSAFVLPGEVIGKTGANEDVVLQRPNLRYSGYGKGGSLEKWQESVGVYCQGNPALMFSVAASLAGPILGLLNVDGSGVHYLGSSSKGKTTIANVAGSAWGKPKAFVVTWAATANGLEGQASLRNDTLLVLDEMKQAQPKDIDQVAYLVANGTGKLRSNRSGNAREPKRWTLFTLSNGERSVEAFLESGGIAMEAGQEVRLPSIPVDGFKHGAFESLGDHPDPVALVTSLQHACSENYGHLGPAFVALLSELMDDDDERQELRDRWSRYVKRFSASGDQERRVAKNFAVVALAGDLAIEWGLLPGVEPNQGLSAALVMFKLWTANKPRGDHEESSILKNIQEFIETHGDSRFQRIRESGFTSVDKRAEQADKDDQQHLPDSGKTSNRVGFRETDKRTGEEVFLFTSKGLQEAAGGYPIQKVSALLDKHGWLSRKESKDLAPKRRIESAGRVRLYHVVPQPIEPVTGDE